MQRPRDVHSKTDRDLEYCLEDLVKDNIDVVRTLSWDSRGISLRTMWAPPVAQGLESELPTETRQRLFWRFLGQVDGGMTELTLLSLQLGQVDM